MAEWYENPYKKGPAVGPDKLARPLYPPDAAPGKTPSEPGPDVLAMKRGVKRAQRWAQDKDFSQLDDAYYNTFAHGTSPNVADSGVAGFQRQEGIDDTGWIGDATYQAMRRALVPEGPNKGKPIFDAEAIRLLEESHKVKPPEGPDIDDIRTFITAFCSEARANEPAWHYSQNRPVDVSVDPSASSITSDCSGFCIQAYYYAKQKTGLTVPDPAKQNWSGYGNTDLYEDDHPKVTNGKFLVGDLAHYNGHVTICHKAGDAGSARFTSHGQEAGPIACELHYRTDLRFVVRPPLL